MYSWNIEYSRIQSLEREECKTFVLTRNAHVGAYGVSDLLSTSVCERTLVSERLLPVYLGSYRYQNKRFQYIVSGITGDVFGEVI